jgi:hypothetical protein
MYEFARDGKSAVGATTVARRARQTRTRRDGDGTTARTNVRGTRGDAFSTRFERAREDDDARDDGARREGW